MVRSGKRITIASLLAISALEALTTAAPAISADLAKKCRELAIKAHRPAVAGSKTGTAQAERDYFRECVARGGTVSDGNEKR